MVFAAKHVTPNELDLTSRSYIDKLSPSPINRQTIKAQTSKPESLQSVTSANSHAFAPSGFHRLPTGSVVAYNFYGEQSGFPLLFFHDSGSSRLEAQFLDASAKSQGFRIISVDRPGVGRSDYHDLPSPKQHCDEVVDLLAALGIEEFGVIGLGAGGVYSLNLAHQQPNKVKFQVCLAGVSGFVFNERVQRPYLTLLWNKLLPPLLSTVFKVKERFFPLDHERAMLELYQRVSFMDRKVLLDPEVRAAISQDQREATQAGPAGVAQDIANSFKRLSFKLNSVSVPTSIWQGAADRLSDRIDCEFMVSNMPRAKFHRISKGGHYFFVHEMETVLRHARYDYLHYKSKAV